MIKNRWNSTLRRRVHGPVVKNKKVSPKPDTAPVMPAIQTSAPPTQTIELLSPSELPAPSTPCDSKSAVMEVQSHGQVVGMLPDSMPWNQDSLSLEVASSLPSELPTPDLPPSSFDDPLATLFSPTLGTFKSPRSLLPMKRDLATFQSPSGLFSPPPTSSTPFSPTSFKIHLGC